MASASQLGALGRTPRRGGGRNEAPTCAGLRRISVGAGAAARPSAKTRAPLGPRLAPGPAPPWWPGRFGCPTSNGPMMEGQLSSVFLPTAISRRVKMNPPAAPRGRWCERHSPRFSRRPVDIERRNRRYARGCPRGHDLFRHRLERGSQLRRNSGRPAAPRAAMSSLRQAPSPAGPGSGKARSRQRETAHRIRAGRAQGRRSRPAPLRGA